MEKIKAYTDMGKELSDYTTKELLDEIKRRNEEKKKRKLEEKRCRNCIYYEPHPQFPQFHLCGKRTWGKTYPRKYAVKPYFKACDKFENIDKE